jgi:hypothetical protein
MYESFKIEYATANRCSKQHLETGRKNCDLAGEEERRNKVDIL